MRAYSEALFIPLLLAMLPAADPRRDTPALRTLRLQVRFWARHLVRSTARC